MFSIKKDGTAPNFNRVHILFLLLIINASWAQVQDHTPSLPPSPTVANLMQFEEVPIDNYTGQPDISVPLLDKSIGGGLNYSLTLRYSTSGIKIDNRSGWTGTGWSLEAGGAVSRTVRGIPDEKKKPVGDPNDVETGIYHLDAYWGFTADDHTEFAWNANGTRYNKYDYELDLYQFSAPGLSGRFVVAREGTVLVAKQLDVTQKLKIVVDQGADYTINGFKITDTNGNTFSFYAKEVTSSVTTSFTYPRNSEPVAPNPYRPESKSVSAWQLTQIKNLTGRVLASFEYAEIEESYEEKSVTSYRFRDQDSRLLLRNPYNIPQLKPFKTEMLVDMTIQTQKLSKVTFKDSTNLTFEHSTYGSHPENGGSYLETIQYKSLSKTLSDFAFTYDITEANSRLWLTKVSENGLEHVFDYTDKELLPAYGAPGDSFGYSMTYFPGRSHPSHALNVYEPDYIKRGLLYSIAYPTGGVKVFDFEANTFSWEGDHQLEDYNDNPINSANSTNPQALLKANIQGAATVKLIPNGTTPPTYTTSSVMPNVHITHKQTVYFNINAVENGAVFALLDLSFHPTGTTPGGIHAVRLDRASTDGVELEAGDYYFTLSPSLIDPDTGESYAPGHEDEIFNPDLDDPICIAGITVVSRVLKTGYEYSHYMTGGGVRIRQVSFKEDATSPAPARKISYSYLEPSEFPEPEPVIVNGHTFYVLNPLAPGPTSSGVVDARIDKIEKIYGFGESKYLFRTEDTSPAQFLPLTVFYIATSRGQNAELAKGNFIAYKHVKVFEDDNGYTKYQYTSARDFPSSDGVFEYPFLPAKNLEFKRGLLTESTVYNKDKQKLSEIKNTYEYSEDTQANTYYLLSNTCEWSQFYQFYNDYINRTPLVTDRPSCAGAYTTVDCFSGLYSNCSSAPGQPISLGIPYLLKQVPLTAGWAKLTETLKSEYYYSGVGQDSISTRTIYDYNPENYQVKQQIQYTNEGSSIIASRTVYEYPLGYTSDLLAGETSAALAMVTKNLVNTPLLVSTFMNDKPLETVINRYNTSGLLRVTQSLKGTGDPEDKIQYTHYDSSGNPTEVIRPGGYPVVFVWGYGETVPVAKIENSNLLEVQHLLNPGNAPNPFATNTALMTAVSGLRTALTKAMVTTLTYEPGEGLKTVTDPNNRTITYYYDNFQRLHAVTDQDGNLVTMNGYHYRTQTE